MRYELDGNGICSGIWDSAEIARQIKEERKKEAELAERVKRAQAFLDQVDVMLDRSLKDEIEAEAEQPIRLTPRQKKDFAEFRKYCEEELDIRALPAPPQAVAAFLITKMSEGARIVERYRNSISAVHRRDFEDPTNDVSVRALMRRVRTTDKGEPSAAEKEGQN
jgi:hypothetical protein